MTINPADASPYRHPSRLAEVLGLLQVLAVSRNPGRTEGGLRSALQAPPGSAATWTEIAAEHPELFRVSHAKEPSVSLVARFAYPAGEDGTRPSLEPSHVTRLAAMVIDMRDRDVHRLDRINEELSRQEERLAEGNRRRQDREREYAAQVAEEGRLRQTTRSAVLIASGTVIAASLAVIAKVLIGF